MCSCKAHGIAKKARGEGDRVRSSGARLLGRGEVQLQHKLIDHGQATNCQAACGHTSGAKGTDMEIRAVEKIRIMSCPESKKMIDPDDASADEEQALADVGPIYICTRLSHCQSYFT